MLIHPWDAMPADETHQFIRGTGFGHLIVPGLDRDLPVVVPTQYVVTGVEPLTIVLHLARPNPVWAAICERPRALLSVLRTQLGALQPDVPVVDPSMHARKLPGIRGIRLTATAVRGKRKWGGNLDDAHREHVLEQLSDAI